MSSGEPTFLDSIIVPARFIMVMWFIFFLEVNLNIDLGVFGILPREPWGLIGVITAPFLHGNIYHLASNTFPLLFLGTTLFWFYDRIAKVVFLQCYIFTNILVWIFARSDSFHIGASGLIYGLAFFMIFFGLFRKDLRSLLISIVVTVMYGGIFYGVLPTQPGVSWESHLMGGIVGTFTALNMSRVRKIRS